MGNDAQASAGERRCTRCGHVEYYSFGQCAVVTCLECAIMHGGCTYADQPAHPPTDDGRPELRGAWWSPERLAFAFHRTYERLAPDYGYETRPETRSYVPESPNGRLMIAVCRELLSALIQPAADDGAGDVEQLRRDLAATRERLIDTEAERDAAVRRAEKLFERLGCEVCGCAYDSEQDDNTTVWCDDCRPDFPQQAYNEMRDRAEAAEARVRELGRHVEWLRKSLREAGFARDVGHAIELFFPPDGWEPESYPDVPAPADEPS